MTVRPLNRQGFAALEALLIIVIVALLGGTGYYVYHANKKTSDTLASASQVAQSSPTKVIKKAATATVQYFTIPEWNVRAKYAGKLSLEYTYTPGTGANALSFIRLSSKELDASDPECASGGDYGGIINRYQATDEFLVGDGDADSGQTAAQFAASLKSSDYGHVGDYYFFYQRPQGVCGPSSQAIQQQTTADVQVLLPSLQAIPQ